MQGTGYCLVWGPPWVWQLKQRFFVIELYRGIYFYLLGFATKYTANVKMVTFILACNPNKKTLFHWYFMFLLNMRCIYNNLLSSKMASMSYNKSNKTKHMCYQCKRYMCTEPVAVMCKDCLGRDNWWKDDLFCRLLLLFSLYFTLQFFLDSMHQKIVEHLQFWCIL